MSLVRTVSKYSSSLAHAAAVAGIIFISQPTLGQTASPLSLAVLETSISVTNVTPGGSIVLFTCERGSKNGRTHVRKQALMLHDDDRDGTVHYTPENKIALRSVWVAVDYSSGATVAAALPRFPLVVTEIPLSRFKKDAEGAVAELDQELRRLILLLVRPGTGAWTLFVRDGKDGDIDRTENARLVLRFADARAIEGKTSAPRQLKSDDVLVAIDPSRLDIYLARIAN